MSTAVTVGLEAIPAGAMHLWPKVPSGQDPGPVKDGVVRMLITAGPIALTRVSDSGESSSYEDLEVSRWRSYCSIVRWWSRPSS